MFITLFSRFRQTGSGVFSFHALALKFVDICGHLLMFLFKVGLPKTSKVKVGYTLTSVA